MIDGGSLAILGAVLSLCWILYQAGERIIKQILTLRRILDNITLKLQTIAVRLKSVEKHLARRDGFEPTSFETGLPGKDEKGESLLDA